MENQNKFTLKLIKLEQASSKQASQLQLSLQYIQQVKGIIQVKSIEGPLRKVVDEGIKSLYEAHLKQIKEAKINTLKYTITIVE